MRLLGSEDLSRIAMFQKVAEINGSLLPLSELADLLQSNPSSVELEQLFMSPPLNSTYQLVSGYVLKKGEGNQPLGEALRREAASRQKALARSIANLLLGAVVVAISGSTSYGSVGQADDIDFFCVVKADNAWIFITRSLLLLRLLRIFSPKFARVCLSCVMDKRYAEQVFKEERDALFARDALTTVVLRGERTYNGLLNMGGWMKEYYPRFYSRKKVDCLLLPAGRASYPARILNTYLFVVIGTYIKIKSFLENRRIARRGDTGRTFLVRMAADHCIFESVRYMNLRRMYNEVYARRTG